uniref:Uncharacterized protein n=1 Tax=Romanomermis culicivorax TaxID=13658 RepID=A0A915KYF2_ROMCU
MPIHNQNLQDPLGNVVQDALANILYGRLRALKAQIAHKVATTEAGLNELRSATAIYSTANALNVDGHEPLGAETAENAQPADGIDLDRGPDPLPSPRCP